MDKDKNIVALLTGRGNNTLKDKNILPVFGKPLLYYPAIAAINSKYVNHFYVSSDDDKILNEAIKLGYNRIKRPDSISKANSQHIDAIKHAVNFMKENKLQPDILLVLLANSVTIKTDWIDSCINNLLEDKSITASVPAYKDSDHHPYRAKRINENGFFEPFFDFSGQIISTNRQDLEPSYFLCHNFWVIRTENLSSSDGQKPWVFMGNKIKPVIIEKGFDVHTEEDLKACEEWLIKEKIAK